MIKLLKYDFRQNMNTILGTFAVLIIVQIMLAITAQVRGWDQTLVLGGSIALYMIVSCSVIIMTCKTFRTNIMAYHIRLLPIRPVWMIVSSMLLGMIVVGGVVVLMMIHTMVYRENFQILMQEVELSLLSNKELAIIFLRIIWNCIVTIIMIFLAITVGYSVQKGKRIGIWLGIITFFVLQYIVSWIETKLFYQTDKLSLPFIETNTNVINTGINAEIKANILDFPWGMFAFELVVTGLMIWAITYLINKRVEV